MGLFSKAQANVTILPEPDYPPKANAGHPVVLYLPHDEVTLSGKDSNDDKGIEKYEWTQVEGKQVDIIVSIYVYVCMYVYV